ncbi:MAG TPA: DUF1292 domain-containing protein [Thermotogota bacterium]|nr:DUF1292 domain-containing protein [Thermotogota bacterium]
MNEEVQKANNIPDEGQNESYEEYELPLLRIEDEDGNEMNYVCLQELELNSKKYLITMEMDSEDESDETLENPFNDEDDELEVFIFIEEGEENGNRIISIVEDDDEFDSVVEAWNKIIETETEQTNPTNTQ